MTGRLFMRSALLLVQWVNALSHAVFLTSMVSVIYLTGLYLHTGKVFMRHLMPGGDPVETCELYKDNGSWETVEDKGCAGDGLILARTMVFLTMQLSEVFRGFTVKSQEPFYVDFFANKALLACTLVSGGLGLMLMVVPKLNDVFG